MLDGSGLIEVRIFIFSSWIFQPVLIEKLDDTQVNSARERFEGCGLYMDKPQQRLN
uniref:Uncharacterized protein n=1 Tax=Arundo donax TaxID=35708 RepID=A0A0A9BH57_ARUDO